MHPPARSQVPRRVRVMPGAPTAALVVVLGWTATGCRPAAVPDPTTSTTSPTGSAFGVVTPTAVARGPLVLWTVPGLAAGGASGDRGPLGTAIDAFTATHPGEVVDVRVRPDRGPAAIAAYLASTARVAPSELPDVAILPLESITDALAAGLAQPLPDRLGGDLIDGTFPFAARRARTAAGEAVAVPFAVDVPHVLARGGPPPDSWAGVLADGGLVVPYGGARVPALAPLLSFYAAAGGDLARLPDVDASAARDAFEFVADGLAGGALQPADVDEAADAAWEVFRLGDARSAVVRVGAFASQQSSASELSWGPLPGRDGAAPPVAWGWAYVVTAAEAERQDRAADLVAALAAPGSRGWVVRAGALPAWTDGWAEAVAGGFEHPPAAEYLTFVHAQLAEARGVDAPERWAGPWSAALGQLVDGGSAPAAATRVAPNP